MDIIEKAANRLKANTAPPPQPARRAVNHPSIPTNSIGRAATNSTSTAQTRQSILPPNRLEQHSKRSISLEFERLQHSGMIVPDGTRSLIKEEYRRIKQPILLNASGKGAVRHESANVAMITSSVPGEGKTFSAINLALSIASERDRTVLLVDADVLRANLSSFFDLNKDIGLVDYLIDDDIALSDVIVRVEDIPSLNILPAGNTHHLSTEILSSTQMEVLAQSLSRSDPNRVIIFDSPPLLHTSEARVLAQLMGQIVIVVEAERTPKKQVQEAFDLLQDVSDDTSISMILNKTRRSRIGSYYYYYYSYGY